jgi:hypothetical protein
MAPVADREENLYPFGPGRNTWVAAYGWLAAPELNHFGSLSIDLDLYAMRVLWLASPPAQTLLYLLNDEVR